MLKLDFLDQFSIILTWLTWAMSIVIPLLAGARHPDVWRFALVKQTVWLILIVISHYWYVFPLWLGLSSAYTYNLFKWNTRAKIERAERKAVRAAS